MTIQVRVRVLTTVDTEEVNLPFCFASGEYHLTEECVMITEDFKIVRVFLSDTHNSMSVTQKTNEQVQEYLEDTFKKYKVKDITVSEFQEKVKTFVSQTINKL